MGLKYDPTAFETWRPNYEMRQALAWFAGCAWYFLWGDVFGATGVTMLFATFCALMGIRAFIPAIRRLRMTLNLAGSPLPIINFEDLKRILNDPAHQSDLWLGKGFAWGQTQTQRVADLLKRDWHKTYREALGCLYILRFLKKHCWFTLFHPLKARHLFLEEQKRLSEIQGQPWIHGVGDKETDVFQPISHSEGHTLIIGTTGSGKTRCFDLLISQAILRGETVFIIDPKGDRDLCQKAKRACEKLGRGDKFVYFHPANPEESVRINLLANWTRPSEIADRISALIPSQSESDPFKNFAFGALNAICSGLCSVYRNPTLKNLKHYLSGTSSGAVAGLVVNALNLHIRTKYPEKEEELDTFLRTLKTHDDERVANALISFYQTSVPMNPDMDDLISLFTHNKEHFSKMITSLLPVLSMLTSGTLGDLLSPSEDPDELRKHPWRDTKELIDWKSVVYVGLDSLSDPMVGSAIGALFLSDLACVAGARYNFETDENSHQETGEKGKGKVNTVNIFVDEAAEVVNTPFLQILNKGRGAHLKLFVATQTIADFIARMGSKERAFQLLGNLNNRICLRCIDTETQNFVADTFPKTKIFEVQRTQGQSTTAHEPMPRGGSLQERLADEEVPIFSPQLLGMLPNLEFIASLSGGHIIKGRYPLILDD